MHRAVADRRHRLHAEIERVPRTSPAVGRPAQVICELADQIPADVIVLGSHGFDVLDRFLGTTAARVVNHAHCNVLVVRPPREP
ncbi:universal stress protein [Nannocystis pusilla]|uniref:universal stress protein n=1 Tax=Nannocystis pusilla TaxID=889268 RepID=UPI003DA2AA53